MKKLKLPAFLLLVIFSNNPSFAQYGQNNYKLNSSSHTNWYNPTAEIIYSADTTINHVDFGQKTNNRSFVILFPFKRIQNNNPASFDFKPSQIKETRMSKHSLVKRIELTNQGFELTYVPSKDEAGPVDDYVAILTENGDIILRLTGEIIDRKKKREQQGEQL